MTVGTTASTSPLASEFLARALEAENAVARLTRELEEARAGLLFANEHITRLEPATFDTLTLDMFEDELRRKVASVPTSEPTPGKHCRFCPARVACPAVPKAFRIKKRAYA